MAEWHEMSAAECEADPEALQQRAADYFNSFLASEGGRRVLFDIEREGFFFDLDVRAEDALAHLMLTSFVRLIRRKCGITDQMAVIRAESDVARGFRPPAEPKEAKNMYDELKLEPESQ